jgi:primosomal protein N'
MGEQSLVLNRRYAPVLMCHDCGFDRKATAHTAAPTAFHKLTHPRLHHRELSPNARHAFVPACGNLDIAPVGAR